MPPCLKQISVKAYSYGAAFECNPNLYQLPIEIGVVSLGVSVYTFVHVQEDAWLLHEVFCRLGFALRGGGVFSAGAVYLAGWI